METIRKKSENSISPKCKVCGKQMTKDFKARGFGIYKCPGCTFEQVNINDKSEKIEYKAEYFASNKYRDVVALRLEHERRLKLLKKFAKQRSRILDYGCAMGEFVNFAKDNFDIYGCDISDEAISMAKKKYLDIKDNLFTLSEFLDRNVKFDVIVLWDVIEHIEFPEQVIRYLKERLSNNGYIILSTPDIGSVFAKLTKSQWPFMTPPEHLSFFTKKSFCHFADKLGFSIIDRFVKGKWANLGFILYKYNRVSRVKIPEWIVQRFSKGWLSKLRIYVPTHDVQYVVMRKK